MVLKLIRITIKVIIYIFVLVYKEVRTFIVTCLLYSCLTITNSNVLGKLAIRDLNNGVIQELLLVDLAKTQYIRDDEGPYSRINLTYIDNDFYFYSNEFPNHLFYINYTLTKQVK